MQDDTNQEHQLALGEQAEEHHRDHEFQRRALTSIPGLLSGQHSRCAECINVAPPRKRNRQNIEAAFNDFKQRFHNSPVQHE